MRINKFVAQATGMSRRAADKAIDAGRVRVNQQQPELGQNLVVTDIITLDNQIISLPVTSTLLMLNKPKGYICSRQGQGGHTIYDLLPKQYHKLKPVGRLDKDSVGLILLTDDGQLANQLTHPRFAKQKTYLVSLDKPLQLNDISKLKQGVQVEDYISHLEVVVLPSRILKVVMSEGRNRQIRRTFAQLGYSVVSLQRVQFGEYKLDRLAVGAFKLLNLEQ